MTGRPPEAPDRAANERGTASADRAENANANADQHAVSTRRVGRLRWAQQRLERFYGLEAGPDVVDFVREGDDRGRETLFVRSDGVNVEIALVLPPPEHTDGHDGLCQILEGVSHFVYLAERARTELPATRLELELQAEVDKFVLLGLNAGASRTPAPSHARERSVRSLHDRLYGRVRFLHPKGTDAGDRYRLANHLAARLVGRLPAELDRARRTLVRFYRAGQMEKIHLARAA